jgi:hypothetical protein
MNSGKTYAPKTTKKGKGVMYHISNLIKKVFQLLRYVIHVVWELVRNSMQLIVFLFSYIVKICSEPSTPCVLSIVLFGIVCTVAVSQWYQIGVWFGGVFGVSNAFGLGAGSLGVLTGVIINSFQLAPQLWKIRKDIAQAYSDLNIKTDQEEDEPINVKERMGDWLSYDHKTLKRTRLVTYAVETGLVLGYCFSSGLNFVAIIQAAISLFLPENCLGLVASTVSVLGQVSEHIHQEPAEDNVKF